MGGLIILSSIIITSLFYIPSYPKIIPVLFMTAGFGIIGFLDDYIKIILKRSEGLTPAQKLAGQIVITGILPGMCLTAARWEPICSFPLQAGLRMGNSFLWVSCLFRLCFCNAGNG